MNVTINGEARSFENVDTVSELVQALAIKSDRVAVELNREIVTRDRWPATPLHDGDRLEIVHFVGGGSAGSRSGRSK